MRLLPHDASFFSYFEQQGQKTVEGCRAFLAMVENPTDLDAARRAGQADRARVRRDHPRGGGGAAQDLHHADRSQRHLPAHHQDGRHHGHGRGGGRSAGALRRQGDDQGGRSIWRAAWSPAPSTCWAPSPASATSASRRAILQHCIEVNRLENVADSILRGALARLFREEKDPIAVIKWKEIYETLESATDRCEDVANIIEGVAPREQLSRPMLIIVAIVLIALVFDYINGFHDAANSIATIVSTRVLTPRQAVLWAGVLQLHRLHGLPAARGAHHRQGDHRSRRSSTDAVLLGALGGAIAWNLITWWYGLPSSSSHALVGGLLGAGISKGGFAVVQQSGVAQDRHLHRRLAGAGDGPGRRDDGAGRPGSSAASSRGASTAGSGAFSWSRRRCSASATARTTRRRRWGSSWPC